MTYDILLINQQHITVAINTNLISLLDVLIYNTTIHSSDIQIIISSINTNRKLMKFNQTIQQIITHNMNLPSQAIMIPQQLTKHSDFLIQISLSNDKVYSHIQYLTFLVKSMYDIYQKMTNELIKLSEYYDKKMTKMNDSTALAILNFIKGISKLFQNIRDQISNNTINLSKKNQKVSKTRKDIVNQKLAKINQLFSVYQQKVQKYNKKEEEYQQKCRYFKKIEQDVLKFYSMKNNKSFFQDVQKRQLGLQEQLQETYSTKMQLKSGLNQIRLSLKQFFEMLSNNADDDKRLLMNVRKKLKETKIFNQTIIDEVNSEAEESIKPQAEDRLNRIRNYNISNNESLNNDLTQRQSIYYPTERDELQWSFPQLKDNMSIQDDIKQINKNIQQEKFSIETFCEFVTALEKEIMANGQAIDKLRNSEDFQKFIDKKFQINELLTSDMINNTESIKNQIADTRQILEGIKGFLNKKKVINQLQKYRTIKFQKFITQTQIYLQVQKKQLKHTADIRRKYKQKQQKFAKGHLELMRRFRQMVQDMFKDISEEFKFQRNPDLEFKKFKNQFIQKKYYSLLMLGFFINKEDTPKFTTNPYLKNYEKFMNEDNLQRVGLAQVTGKSPERDRKSAKKGWGCFGISLSPNQKTSNKYIDEYNCALKNGIVLIQGKMKIHQNYLKFISSFNAKTFLGQTNLRIPKCDIESFERKYILLSLVLVVNTIHGQLCFTSFLSDPYQKLMQVYENKQPLKKITSRNQFYAQEKPDDTRYEEKVTEKTSNQTFIVTNYSKSPRNNNSGNFITQLQEKFQSQIPHFIDKTVVNFQSLSTYLSQSKKELSISVQYNLVNNKDKRYFFQIKIIDKNSKLQYKFVHEKSMENEKIKKMLELMVADIVNNKFNASSNPKRLPPTLKKISNSDENKQKKLKNSKRQSTMSSGFKTESDKINEETQYSFIERKENNQFEFDRDPSFVYVRQSSVGHHGGDPSFNYVPDLQIFKNMESEKKITFGPAHYEMMSKSLHSDNSNQSRKHKNEHSLTQKQINEYINSIDEKDIQKSLRMSGKGRVEKKYSGDELNRIDVKKQLKSEQQLEKRGLRANHLILGLIIIVGLNFIVSILK